MRRIIAVDPGLMTGLASVDADGVVRTAQLTFEQVCDYVKSCPSPEAVICERYTITYQTLKKTRQHWSLEVIGVFRALAYQAGAVFELQGPGDAKTFASDKMLRDKGLLPRGDHARDAVRHLTLSIAKLEGVRVLDGLRLGGE